MSVRVSTRFFASLTKKNTLNINNCIKFQDKFIRPKTKKILGATESHHNPIEINQLKNESKKSKDEYKNEIIRLLKFNDFFV